MEDGTCAYDGCGGKVSGGSEYCKWHNEKTPPREVPSAVEIAYLNDALRPSITLLGLIGTMMVLAGLPMIAVGLYWLLIDNTYVGSQIAGSMMLVFGGICFSLGTALRS